MLTERDISDNLNPHLIRCSCALIRSELVFLCVNVLSVAAVGPSEWRLIGRAVWKKKTKTKPNSLNNQSINRQQQQSSLPLINCQCLHGVAFSSCRWSWFVSSPQWLLLTTELSLSFSLLLLKLHISDDAFKFILLYFYSPRNVCFESLRPSSDVICRDCQSRRNLQWWVFYVSDRGGNVCCKKPKTEKLDTDLWFFSTSSCSCRTFVDLSRVVLCFNGFALNLFTVVGI